MTRFLLPLLLFIQSPLLYAGLLDVFKDEEGRTKWQWVANFSSGVLIILLTLVVIVLFITWQRARRYNRALEEIRANLEQRVRERTAKLEHEVAEHVVTTRMLKASEAYIQNILRSMPLVLVGLDREGTITHWNLRAEEISGIKAADAIGKNLWSIYSDITISPRHIEQALDKGETITLRHSQPGSYHFDITVYPLQDYDEPGVVILVDDVTKRVTAENMLIHHDKLSSMGELATAMASDINTPLQAILFDLRSFQGILESGKLLPAGTQQSPEGEKLQQLLSNASKSGQKVESIIRNLLQFARGRTDKPQQANVVDILEHSLEQSREVLSLPDTFPFSDIRIEPHFEPDLPLIPCYVTELQQVFLSLFRHAYKSLTEKHEAGYTPTIKLYVAKCYDALSVRIQHNGVGLTSEEQMYLFEPYMQEGNIDKVAEGANKRLSFAHFVITEQHQGHMAVTSDPAVGTTFHIQLDLV
ncbi:Sensory box histidine kinase [Marinobacterium lacunae]|uniref:histidine kinase n=1 Tax=Marinobacterium lacunae TaxID=1232683 RepID=A0A081G4G2_9GAMM|nr:PAS domain S-box protein [Marinobacterium lacunae]KEA65667.1 Sensory box histidine kinase [Marinobacterium lacunae]MBR9882728.1 PAS domain S-box protein [Oceanospirillales bacterium]